MMSVMEEGLRVGEGMRVGEGLRVGEGSVSVFMDGGEVSVFRPCPSCLRLVSV